MSITIELMRWRDIAVGDVVLDPRWRWQRWQRVTKIHHDGDATEVWWRPDEHDRCGYQTSGLELVQVQRSI